MLKPIYLPKNAMLILFLFVVGIPNEAEGWSVVDLIGSNPVNFNNGASPTVNFQITFQEILGNTETLTTGYSIGLWAQRLYSSIPYSIANMYDSSNNVIFSIGIAGAPSTYPFRMYCLNGTVNYFSNSSYNTNTYWTINTWTYFFFSYNYTSTDIFGFQNLLASSSRSFNFSGSGTAFKQPDSASFLWLGGSSPSINPPVIGCKCQLALVRFYSNLFVNDLSLMSKFSDYGTEMIYFFNFMALSTNYQNFVVSQESMVFAVNSTGIEINASIIGGNLGLTSSTESSDPFFGPYYISCSGGQISSFKMTTNLSNLTAIILVFRIQSSLPSNTDQMILLIQSSTTSPYDYQIKYSIDSNSLVFTNGNSSMSTDTGTITPGSWYNVVISSYYQAYGSSSGNFIVYLNSVVTPVNLTGNISQIPLTHVNPTVYLCGTIQTDGTLGPNGSYIDISRLDILSLTGAAYPEPGDTFCALWFHYGSQIAYCAICQPDNFFYQGNCYQFCPSGYFGHSDTLTCQSCGSSQNMPKTSNYVNDLPFITVTINLSNSNALVESCTSLQISLVTTSVPQQNCGPYSVSWQVSSNSSNSTADALIQNYCNINPNSTSLSIPAGMFGFGMAYNFTVIMMNLNNVSGAVNWTTFTTYGGSYCASNYSFPDFTITTTSGTLVSTCNSIGMMITPASVVGPTYSSYYYQWTVTTIPENSTEAIIQSNFLNGLSDETNVSLSNNTLLVGYNYTFQATIYVDESAGISHSITIQTTACWPDFYLTGSSNFDVCSPISINVTEQSSSSSSSQQESFTFSWAVSTNASNTSENTRVANYLNSLTDNSEVSIPPGYLLFKVNYTFTATIVNSFGAQGGNRSVSYLGLMCPTSGGCIAPLYYSNGSCVSQCLASSKIVTTNDPTLGKIQSCVAGADVSMSASITKVPDQISINFDQPILSLLNDSASQILITLAGYNITQADNYSVTITSDSSMQVSFNFSMEILAGTEAQISFFRSYLPMLYKTLEMNNYNIKNVNCSMGLLEYYPFSSTETAIISGASSITTIGSAAINAVMTASQVASAGGSSFLLGAALAATMIQLNRFVNVSYPPNLLILYNNSLQTVISLTLPINLAGDSNSAKNSSSSKSSLRVIDDGTKFALYEISPYFLINGVSPLVTVGSLLVLLLLVKLLKKYKNFSVRIRKLFKKIEEFLGWNFILTIVVSTNLKFSLYIALNLAYPDFDSALGVTSFIFSVGFAIISFLLLRHFIKVVRQNYLNIKKKKDNVRSLPLRAEWNLTRSYKILLEDYKNDNVWQPLYVPIMFFRSIAIGTILVLFKTYGFTSALCLFCMSLVSIAYMLRHRPIKDRTNLVLQIIFDSIIMIVSLLVLILSLMDVGHKSNANTRLNIGWTITIANYIIQGLSLLKVLWMVGKLIYDLILTLKDRLTAVSKPPTTVNPSVTDSNLSNSSIIKNTIELNSVSKSSEEIVRKWCL